MSETNDTQTLLIWLLIALGIGLILKAVDLLHRRSRRSQQANAPAVLDAAFDGRQSVIFPVDTRTLHSSEVIAGGIERGYKLVSNTGGRTARVLVFERA